jgi:hypothetical protein
MKSFMFNAQLTKLWYCSTNLVADLNLDISVIMRRCFRLNDPWVILYVWKSLSIYFWTTSHLFWFMIWEIRSKRRLCNGELHNPRTLQNSITVIKSRTKGHVARMGR